MEKRVVRWGGATLGAGRPVICVPVMGSSPQALGAAARAAAACGAEMIELRADSLSPMPQAAEAMAMCRAVRAQAPGVPLLFTLRTARDGGAGSVDASAYEALLTAVCGADTRLCEAVDCELSAGEPVFGRVVQRAHAAGIGVVGSSHDFARTPPEAEICARLAAMERLGADVCKIAVMPRSRLDVLTLMRASVLSDEALAAPVIAIAMGPLGALTRIGGEAMGSCLTFGTAGQASAPGQINAHTLREALLTVHAALKG